MIPSLRARESIKLGLAIAISYGVSLQMGWERPYWAAFAVAFCALSTTGQSLNKGGLRILGTLLGAVVALTLIALFPQERWTFMVFLSAWIALCTYKMAGTRHQYLWFVAGLVTAIICFDGGANSQNAFQTAVLRIEETTLGFLVYTLISVLLWPTSSAAELDEVAGSLLETQRDLYREYLAGGKAAAVSSGPSALATKEVQLLGKLSSTLDAALVDTYAVWEIRSEWRLFQHTTTELMEVLEHWRESRVDLLRFDPQALVHNIEAVHGELDHRLERCVRILKGSDSDRELDIQQHRPIQLDIDEPAVAKLTHFEWAAASVTRAQLERLDVLTRTLVECAQSLKGALRTPPPRPALASRGVATIDPDRLVAAVRAAATVWCAFLVWIYVENPGGAGIITLGCPMGMIMATTPQMRVSKLFVPATIGIAIGAGMYTFVMPHLSKFAQLGPLLFAVSATIAYVFADPRQGLSKTFGLALFVSVIGITNEQSYNFLNVVNTAAEFTLVFAVLLFFAYFPFSGRPEKAFLRLLRRFFRNADFMLARFALDWESTKGIRGRYAQALYSSDLLELPRKLSMWGAMIDQRELPATSAKQIEALTVGLQTLAYRIKETADARAQPHAEILVSELSDDMRTWRVAIQDLFRGWSKDPSVASSTALAERLSSQLQRMEARVAEVMNRLDDGQLEEEDYARFYRLLGDFRGLSEAMVAYAAIAQSIDWDEWHQARF